MEHRIGPTTTQTVTVSQTAKKHWTATRLSTQTKTASQTTWMPILITTASKTEMKIGTRTGSSAIAQPHALVL